MPKTLIRLVAVFMIPCLLLDPLRASGFAAHPKPLFLSLFVTEALAMEGSATPIGGKPLSNIPIEIAREIESLREKVRKESSVAVSNYHYRLVGKFSGKQWSEGVEFFWDLLLGEGDLQFDESARHHAMAVLRGVRGIPKPVLYAKLARGLHRAIAEKDYLVAIGNLHYRLVDKLAADGWTPEAEKFWDLLLGEGDLHFNESARHHAMDTLRKAPGIPKSVLYAKLATALHRAVAEGDYSVAIGNMHYRLVDKLASDGWTPEAEQFWDLLLGEGDLQFDESARHHALESLRKVPGIPKPVLYAKLAAGLHRAVAEGDYSVAISNLHYRLLGDLEKQPWTDDARPLWEALLGKNMKLEANLIVEALDGLSGGQLSELGLKYTCSQWLTEQPAASALMAEPPIYELFRDLSNAATRERFTALVESLSDRDIGKALELSHAIHTGAGQATNDWRPEADAVLAFWKSGIALTPGLLQQYLDTAEDSRAELLQSWGSLVQSFESQDLRFDRANPLHAELGYTLLFSAFEQAKQYKGAGSPKMSYKAYRELLAQDETPVITDETHRGELYCLSYEARRSEAYAAALQEAAKGRKVILVENKSYGAVAMSPLGRRLLQKGIRVVTTKIGSTESHNNPYVFRANLFSDDELRFIAKNRPVIIVVDGSTSVNDASRTLAHYPDAYQGYQTQMIALHLIFGQSERDTIEHFGITPEFLQKVKEQSGFSKLQERIINLGLQDIRWESRKGGLAFWTPSEVPLQIRQRKKGLGFDQVPHPLQPADWRGEDMVFVQTAMELEAIRHAAARGDKAAAYLLKELPRNFRHQAAYFDDTRHFLQFHIRIGPYGPAYSRLYADVAQSMYRELLEADGLPTEVETSRFPFRLILADYDRTLGRTLRPLHGSMASLIVDILAQGSHFSIITGQSSKDLRKNLIEPLLAAMSVRNDLPDDLLTRLHLGSTFGTAGWDVTERGKLIETYNLMNETATPSQLSDLQLLVSHYVRDIPNARLENHDEALAIEDLPSADRDRHQQTLQLSLNQQHMPFDVIPVGRHGLRVVPRGMTKAVARDRLLDRFSDIPRDSVLTIGNDYSGSQIADNHLAVRGARNVSVSREPVHIEGIEHIGHEDRGAYELLLKLSNTSEKADKPSDPIPPLVYDVQNLVARQAIPSAAMFSILALATSLIHTHIVVGVVMAAAWLLVSAFITYGAEKLIFGRTLSGYHEEPGIFHVRFDRLMLNPQLRSRLAAMSAARRVLAYLMLVIVAIRVLPHELGHLLLARSPFRRLANSERVVYSLEAVFWSLALWHPAFAAIWVLAAALLALRFREENWAEREARGVVALSDALEPLRDQLEVVLLASNLAARYRLMEASQTGVFRQGDQLQIRISRRALHNGSALRELEAVLTPLRALYAWPDQKPSKPDPEIAQIAENLNTALKNYPNGDSFRQFWAAFDLLLTKFARDPLLGRLVRDAFVMNPDVSAMDPKQCARFLGGMLKFMNTQGLLDYGWLLYADEDHLVGWASICTYRIVEREGWTVILADIDDPDGRIIPSYSGGATSLDNYILFDTNRLENQSENRLSTLRRIPWRHVDSISRHTRAFSYDEWRQMSLHQTRTEEQLHNQSRRRLGLAIAAFEDNAPDIEQRILAAFMPPQEFLGHKLAQAFELLHSAAKIESFNPLNFVKAALETEALLSHLFFAPSPDYLQAALVAMFRSLQLVSNDYGVEHRWAGRITRALTAGLVVPALRRVDWLDEKGSMLLNVPFVRTRLDPQALWEWARGLRACPPASASPLIFLLNRIDAVEHRRPNLL